jgi:hypothetical protein
MEQQNTERQPVMRIAKVWQAWTAEVCGAAKRPFTPKELGQFKCLRRTLGHWTTFVMHWVINNWDSFAKKSKSAAGLDSAPLKPHIGFLLCHYNIAVGLMISAAKAKTEDAYFNANVLEMDEELRKRHEEQLQAWAEAEQAVDVS